MTKMNGKTRGNRTDKIKINIDKIPSCAMILRKQLLTILHLKTNTKIKQKQC